MAIDIYKQAREAEHTITGKRWCSQCQRSRETGGGNWKEFDGGKRRRWECMSCKENRAKREGS